MSSATAAVETNVMQMPSSSLMKVGFNLAVTSSAFSLLSSSRSTAPMCTSTTGSGILQLSSSVRYPLPTIINSLVQVSSTTNISLVSASLCSLFSSAKNTMINTPSVTSSENVMMSNSQPHISLSANR